MLAYFFGLGRVNLIRFIGIGRFHYFITAIAALGFVVLAGGVNSQRVGRKVPLTVQSVKARFEVSPSDRLRALVVVPTLAANISLGKPLNRKAGIRDRK